MDDDQPTEPWISRSAWALAPMLFFYELLFPLSFLFGGLLLSILILPVMAYFIYRVGIKCAMEELAPKVPRRRLWGTAFLVALIHCFFLFLLFKDQLNTLAAQSPEQFKQLLDPIITSSKFGPEDLALLTPSTLQSILSLSIALVISLGLFLLHLIALWVGVRTVEKVRS
jgi:hypothetical protein